MMLILRKMRHEYFSIGGDRPGLFQESMAKQTKVRKSMPWVRWNSPGSAERSKGRVCYY
jgi:hypothetical protein